MSYIDTLSSTSGVTATTEAKKQTLDQNAFLKLLTTQLKTQDPFQPVDNTQMVAQMAQFSSVAGISEMNTSLKSMATDLAASRLGGAASWIGKSALVTSDVAVPLADGSYGGEIALPADAKSVQLTLTDANGTVVDQQSFGATPKGTLSFRSTPKDASGPLALTVTAYGTTGSTLPATTAAWTPVVSVESPASGDTKLNTALGSITATQALRLS